MRPGDSSAVVTGASSGIGLAVAERLAREGHRVLALARNVAGLESKESILAERLDLERLEELPVALETLARRHRNVRVVVSNAGRGRFGSLEEHSYDEIRSLLDLNFVSHAFVARAFLPHLKRRGGGHLVFIGSEAAIRGSRYGSVYCASKFALRGLAQALRDEAASAGVAVSIVNPGMVRTPFFDRLDFEPGERPENALAPEDVAEAIWLAVSARPGAVVDEINLSPLTRVVRKKGRS